MRCRHCGGASRRQTLLVFDPDPFAPGLGQRVQLLLGSLRYAHAIPREAAGDAGLRPQEWRSRQAPPIRSCRIHWYSSAANAQSRVIGNSCVALPMLGPPKIVADDTHGAEETTSKSVLEEMKR